MRVFYGIVFNDETKIKIFKVQQELIKIAGKGKFVPKEHFHITLRFIGEIKEEQVKDYAQLLFNALRDHQKFTLTTSYIGSFSRGKKVLPWLGIKDNDSLIILQKSLQESLIRELSLEAEVFTPHITLGREVEIKSSLNTLQVQPFEIMVNRLALFESRTINGKLNYIERAVVHLI